MKSDPREWLLFAWQAYPLRSCRTMHECCLCNGRISYGDQYFDAGYGRRAHYECAIKKQMARKEQCDDFRQELARAFRKEHERLRNEHGE